MQEKGGQITERKKILRDPGKTKTRTQEHADPPKWGGKFGGRHQKEGGKITQKGPKRNQS